MKLPVCSGVLGQAGAAVFTVAFKLCNLEHRASIRLHDAVVVTPRFGVERKRGFQAVRKSWVFSRCPFCSSLYSF